MVVTSYSNVGCLMVLDRSKRQVHFSITRNNEVCAPQITATTPASWIAEKHVKFLVFTTGQWSRNAGGQNILDDFHLEKIRHL